MRRLSRAVVVAALLSGMVSSTAWAAQAVQLAPPRATSTAAAVSTPDGYVVGAEDVLGIVFWKDAEMSTDVVVRPDGMITLPLLGEVKAAGLTPVALQTQIRTAAGKLFVEDPNIAVIVKQVNSRRVFITGQVTQSNKFPVSAPLSVLQLISLAGGLKEYADAEHITILRSGRVFKFNYKNVSRGKEPDFQLQPGDTVVVP